MAEAKILVVEDDALTALGIQNRLEGLGYNVLAITPSGEIALKMAEEMHPDLVLMDVKLQGDLDGIQTAGLIRQRCHIPVVYITAYTDEDTLQRAKVTEPLGYLIKPVRLESLKSTLEMALYKQAMSVQLQESEERFRYIFDTTAVAIWEEDFSQAIAAIEELKVQGVKDFRRYLEENPQLVTQAIQMIKILDVNQQTLDMYGAKSKDELLASLDQISVPETQEIIKEELIAIAEGRRFFAGETVNKTLQGERLDILLTISLPEHASEYESVLVSIMDITKRKKAEQALRESEARYRQIIETAQEGIWIIDSENKTTFVNQKMAEMLGYAIEEMIGIPIFGFMDGDTKAIAADFSDRRRQGLAEQQDFKFKRKDGGTLWAIVSTTSLFSEKGEYTGALAMMTDITSRKNVEGMLRYFSTHDALTGLYNRAFFEEQVSRLEQERDYPVSIVIADIDNLKATNDHHGHAAGDELLRQAAQSMTNAFRREDIIARIGGDEFAVLLPNANKPGVKKILSRIKDNVRAYNATHQEIPFNLSLGTSLVEIGDSLSEALKQADAMMYSEKYGKQRKG